MIRQCAPAGRFTDRLRHIELNIFGSPFRASEIGMTGGGDTQHIKVDFHNIP